MKYFLLSTLLIIDMSISAQKPDAVKKMPALQKERVQNIDIKHIAIELQFDWAKQQAFGTTTILFSPLSSTNKIKLDAGMLTINSILLQSDTKLQYNYDGGDRNDNLEITLDKIYNKNDEISIKINYRTNHINRIDPNSLSGSNGKGLRFSQATTNDPIKSKEIWSFGDPESNRYWFPCYDAPNDLRTTEFTARVDKNLTVISNGKRSSVKSNPDGTETWHWKSDIPYANHLTAFVVGEFSHIVEIDAANKLTYHNYGALNQIDWIVSSTERLSDMLNYFSKVTKLKYPYEDYSQVFVQGIGSFLGNNGFSTITENMVDDYGTHADFYYLWDQTEAEALAQQWFGNCITAKDWSEVWLNKSFAHYFTELYNEQKNGKDEFLMYPFSFDQSVYFADWNSGYRRPIVTQNFDDIYNFTNDNYATYRGSLVLHMLRKHIGEDKWWKIIELYTKNNAGKLVTTKDFQSAVNAVSGENLDWFFDQWVYKMGHPIFEITKAYDPVKRNLTLVVKQTQRVDTNDNYPQVNFFKGKVAIEIDEKVEVLFIEPKEENTYNFSLVVEPKLINFDYEGAWIKEVSFKKSFNELLYQLKNSKDILARQIALNELALIAKNKKTTIADKEKVITAFRSIILSNAYFRLKNSAIIQLRKLNVSAENKVDKETISILLTAIKREKSWTLAALINSLGMTKDLAYVDLYIKLLNDSSGRVISAAAIALGKTKSPKAFNALSKLVTKPSMKSQSLLSALAGLKELGDTRAYDIAYKALADLKLPRWRLPDGSIWDYRIFAAQLINSIGKASETYPLISDRVKKSMDENDLEGILNNLLIINELADSRGQEVYDLLKIKYKDDETMTNALTQYEVQFKEVVKNR